jgi:hypothetical protein
MPLYPSDIMGETQSLTTTPVAIASGRPIALTTIYGANAHATAARWLHVLHSDGTTRYFSLLLPPTYSGIVWTCEGGCRFLDGVKLASSDAKGALSGTIGTDVDAHVCGRNAA